MTSGYETLTVTFSDPIKVLEKMFDDAAVWGTASLKGWLESYESTRMTPINEYMAVITSEYNMEYVREWLERHTPLAGCISY